MELMDEVLNSVEKQGQKPAPAFDKDAWAAQKKQERTEAFGLIDALTERVSTEPEMMKKYLDVQARLDRYSVGNALLITAQRPTATRLADYDTWRERGAFIRKGEHPITILEPGAEYTRKDGTAGVNYDVKKVFDVSQTNTLRPKEPAPHTIKELVRALMAASPVPIRALDNAPEGYNVQYNAKAGAIHVQRGLDPTLLFRGLAANIAYAKFDRQENKPAEIAYAAIVDTYILCRRNGISVEGLNVAMPEAMQGMGPKELRAQLDVIRSNGNDISRAMYPTLSPRKNAPQKNDEQRSDAR